MDLCCKGRKERETEERKRYIMDAAEHLFATTGYYNTSVSDIAKEAEFGIGTLYKYFKDKDTLFEELIKDRMVYYFETIEGVLTTDKEPAEKIKDYIHAYVNMLANKREFYKIFFTYVQPLLIENEQSISYDLSEVQSKRLRLFELLDDVIKEGIEKKQLRDMDSSYIVAAVFGIHISVYFMKSHSDQGEWDTKEIEESIQKVLFDSILVDKNFR